MNVEDRPLKPLPVALLLTTLTLALHLAGPRRIAPAPLLSVDAWLAWFGRVDSVAVAADTVRLLALGTCYHLLAMQVLAAVGRRVDLPAVSRFAHALTPPPLRAGVGAIAGIGITALTSLAGPVARVGAEAPPSTAAIHVIDPGVDGTVSVTVLDPVDREPPPRLTPEYGEGRAVMVAEVPIAADGAAGSHGTDQPGPDDGEEDRHHVVRPGDHMWSIAADEVGRAGGERPDTASIERYWHRLVLANPQLDDADLVFPGDVITLPPVGHTG